MPAPRFTPQTLAFLRSLKRHNDREWFRVHRDQYEEAVRGPMVEVIERLALDLPGFAPELVAVPKTSMYRIYRDTRFSPDKSPFKTHAAAIFPHRSLPKHRGAGLYFHVAADHVMVGAGIYAPEPRSLYAIRRHIAANAKRFRAVVESTAFTREFGGVSGDTLKRVPRGFDPAHPAADYLRHRQFLAGTEKPAEFATRPRFYQSLLRLFEKLGPFVRFLNEPLADRRSMNLSPLSSV